MVGNPGGHFKSPRRTKGSTQPDKFRSKSTELKKEFSPSKHPRVPKATDKPILGLRSKINYVLENPRKMQTRIIPDDKSDNPMQSKRFAKVPDYIGRIRQILNQDKRRAEIAEKQRLRKQYNDKHLMSFEEAKKFKDSLKNKWESVNSNYQLMTHSKPDSNVLIRKKENFEKELEQLEKDLKRLDKPFIMVDKTC